MTEVIVFPDVEKLVCDYLRAELVSYASTEVPVGTRKRDAPEFVRVIRTGGNRDSLVTEAATVTIETYADGEVRAQRLAMLCRALIGAADVIGGVQVYRVTEFAAPQNLPDPATAQVRYSATYAIRVRGRAE